MKLIANDQECVNKLFTIFKNLKAITDSLVIYLDEVKGVYIQGLDRSQCCIFYIKFNLFCFKSFEFYIYLYITLHRPYTFDIPLRPCLKCVPEQEQPIAVACPLTAPVTQVHARGEMQPVHIVVPHRPDPDHWVEHGDKSTGDPK